MLLDGPGKRGGAVSEARRVACAERWPRLPRELVMSYRDDGLVATSEADREPLLDFLVCDVCGSEEEAAGDELLACDTCRVAVHQCCYGVASVPRGEWSCNACAQGLRPRDLVCALCPRTGAAAAAFKQLAPPEDGAAAAGGAARWAHSVCTDWAANRGFGVGVREGNVGAMGPVEGVPFLEAGSAAPPESMGCFNSATDPCVVCSRRSRVQIGRGGACLRCDDVSTAGRQCTAVFHACCAREANPRGFYRAACLLDWQTSKCYCPQHSAAARRRLPSVARPALEVAASDASAAPKAEKSSPSASAAAAKAPSVAAPKPAAARQAAKPKAARHSEQQSHSSSAKRKRPAAAAESKRKTARADPGKADKRPQKTAQDAPKLSRPEKKSADVARSSGSGSSSSSAKRGSNAASQPAGKAGSRARPNPHEQRMKSHGRAATSESTALTISDSDSDSDVDSAAGRARAAKPFCGYGPIPTMYADVKVKIEKAAPSKAASTAGDGEEDLTFMCEKCFMAEPEEVVDNVMYCSACAIAAGVAEPPPTAAPQAPARSDPPSRAAEPNRGQADVTHEVKVTNPTKSDMTSASLQALADYFKVAAVASANAASRANHGFLGFHDAQAANAAIAALNGKVYHGYRLQASRKRQAPAYYRFSSAPRDAFARGSRDSSYSTSARGDSSYGGGGRGYQGQAWRGANDVSSSSGSRGRGQSLVEQAWKSRQAPPPRGSAMGRAGSSSRGAHPERQSEHYSQRQPERQPERQPPPRSAAPSAAPVLGQHSILWRGELQLPIKKTAEFPSGLRPIKVAVAGDGSHAHAFSSDTKALTVKFRERQRITSSSSSQLSVSCIRPADHEEFMNKMVRLQSDKRYISVAIRGFELAVMPKKISSGSEAVSAMLLPAEQKPKANLPPPADPRRR